MALINWRGEEVKKEEDEGLDMNYLRSVKLELGKGLCHGEVHDIFTKRNSSPSSNPEGHIYQFLRLTDGSMTFNLSSKVRSL